MLRAFVGFTLASGLLATLPAVAFAQAQATPPPATTPDAAAPQYSINQNVGDWVVRCVLATVKSPAPCEVIQITVNKDSKQRLSSISIAYVPSRESYAMQIVVPTGVAFAKGLTLGTSPTPMKYTRCEQDGCYVESVIDNTTVTALTGAGKSTSIGVVVYGKGNEIKFPLSLNGFPEALDRMKTFARERAVALPSNAAVLPSTTPPAAAPVAPAAAPSRPAKPAR